jgi:hypothetical protein
MNRPSDGTRTLLRRPLPRRCWRAPTGLDAQTASKIPHIGYVYPAGGRQGTEFEVIIGGQDIPEVQDIYFSGSGIKAKVVKWYRPLTQGQYVSLSQKIQFTREDLQAEQEKKGSSEPITDEVVYKMAGITENDLKEMEIYRQRNADPKRQPNDQIAEELTLKSRSTRMPSWASARCGC